MILVRIGPDFSQFSGPGPWIPEYDRSHSTEPSFISTSILGRTIRKLIFGDVFKNGKLLDTISDAKEDDYEVVVYWEKCTKTNAHRTKTGVYVTCSAAHTKWGAHEIMEHILVDSHDVIDQGYKINILLSNILQQ